MVEVNTYASLGYNCEAAYQFRRVTGCDEASFFNWTFCKLSSVMSLIRADFAGVVEWENIQPIGIMIYDRQFDLSFHGDVFKTTNEGEDVEAARRHLTALQHKLAHLAGRWRDTAASDAHTSYFLKLLPAEIEPGHPRELARGIRDLLQQTYPAHRFSIIVLQSLELVRGEDDWGEDLIFNRYLDRYAPDSEPWDGHTASWDAIFAEFPVAAQLAGAAQ